VKDIISRHYDISLLWNIQWEIYTFTIHCRNYTTAWQFVDAPTGNLPEIASEWKMKYRSSSKAASFTKNNKVVVNKKLS